LAHSVLVQIIFNLILTTTLARLLRLYFLQRPSCVVFVIQNFLFLNNLLFQLSFSSKYLHEMTSVKHITVAYYYSYFISQITFSFCLTGLFFQGLHLVRPGPKSFPKTNIWGLLMRDYHRTFLSP